MAAIRRIADLSVFLFALSIWCRLSHDYVDVRDDSECVKIVGGDQHIRINSVLCLRLKHKTELYQVAAD